MNSRLSLPNKGPRLWKSGLRQTLFSAILGLKAPWALAQTAIENPIDADDFGTLVVSIAETVRDIALPLAFAALVFVGFRFVTATAAGDKEGLTAAKKMLLWVVVGTAILVGATVLAEAIVETAKKL